MTFNRLMLKMIRANYKKYLFYLVCNSVAVTLFFLFVTLYANPSIGQLQEADSIRYALAIPAITLILFTVFFISQAHSIFMKKRKSEFGLLMTLGMTNRDIAKILVLENGLIAILAVGGGFLVGGALSWVVFLVVSSYSAFTWMSFDLTAEMFLWTIGLYMIVFILSVGRTFILLFKQGIHLTLKSDRVAETIKMKSPFLGTAGFIIICASVLGLYLTYTLPNGGDFLTLWLISTFMGLYVAINQFASALIGWVIKRKSHYYTWMIPLSSLDYKFKQLTSTLMLVTIMIMVTVLYNTILLFTFADSQEQLFARNPYDIAFIQTNSDVDKAFTTILNQNDNPIEEHVTIPLYSYNTEDEFGWMQTHHILSEDVFNQMTSTPVALNDSEYIYYVNDDREDEVDYVTSFAPLVQESDGPFTYVESIVERHFNSFSGEFIIVNQSDFERIQRAEGGVDATIQLINVADWQRSSKAVETLSRREFTDMESPIEPGILQVTSKIEAYHLHLQTNGLSFFIFSFISILFLFGSFLILYLNIFSTLDKEKIKFNKLIKIGLTSNEAKRMIAKELMVLFVTPTLAGIILSLLFIIAMATDVGGVLQNPTILMNFFVVACIYLLMQTAFYFYSSRKMFMSILYSE